MTVSLDQALAAHAAGLCVVPPAHDGSKRPDVTSWSEYQHRLSTHSEIERWYQRGRDGIGIICGQVSGGLEMLEFEGRAVEAGLVERFEALCHDLGLGELVDRISLGYSERTPSGGIHLLYRCPTPHHNTKLARRPATDLELEVDPDDKIKVLLETRGEGGYVVVAPSSGRVHSTGAAWEQIYGTFDSIVTITDDERDALWNVARSLDQLPDALPAPAERPPATERDGDGPADDYNRRTTWQQLLERHNWTRVLVKGHVTYWRRPGKEGGGVSATTNHGGHDMLIVFSTSTPFETERGYTRFAAYAVLEHNGDQRAAGRDLYAQGYGKRREPSAPVERSVPNEPDADYRPPGADVRDNGEPKQQLASLRPFHRIEVDLTADIEPTPIIEPWLYGGGCLTVLQSEPGVGKSWLALWLALHVMGTGLDVIYLDEEGGLELVHERLRALGADPGLVRRHFWYYAFEGRLWAEEDMLALAALLSETPRPGLAVLDSLPDFLAVANQDEDRARDVTRFIKQVCGAFRDVGCSQLLLDHLTKPASDGTKKRSRYSRGSGSKLGKADATLLLEADQEFDAHTSGSLRIWKTKDRRGRLPLPALGKTGATINVTVSGGTVAFVDQPHAESATWDGPTECMNAILALLETTPGIEFSKRRLVTAMRAAGHPFRDGTIHQAAERLAMQQRLTYRKGPKNSDLYSHRKGGQLAAVPLDEEEF